MVTSQNGYPAPCGDLTKIKAGQAVVSVRAGDVATVLQYLFTQFNAKVEPLKKGSCGGYNYRVVRGGKSLSNHASGTAVDLNWNDHPLGKEGTYSAAQVKEIRVILKALGGVVRWGGDYTHRKDEMHFEIVGSAAQVAKVAQGLNKPAAPKPPVVVPKPVEPPKAPAPKVEAPKPAAKPVAPTKPKPQPKYVTVKKGDSLSKIAQHAGISLARLLALNPKKKKNPDAIDIGERIRVS